MKINNHNTAKWRQTTGLSTLCRKRLLVCSCWPWNTFNCQPLSCQSTSTVHHMHCQWQPVLFSQISTTVSNS